MINAPPPLSRTIQVFCVDDNPLVIEALQVQLERVPDVAFAGSADRADDVLEQIADNPPDVLLMDVSMPGKSPFEATRSLAEALPEVRVLMYSGLVERRLVDRAIEAGAWGYVAKADQYQELVPAIRKVVDGSFAFTTSVESML